MATPPPFVGPREGDGTARALLERHAGVHGRDTRLLVQALAETVRARFGQQQRLRSRHVLQSGKIGAKLRLSMEIEVETTDVVAVQVQVLGWRIVHIGQEAIRHSLLAHVVEISEELLDAALAVPAHDIGRDLVADGEEQRGRMCRQSFNRGGHLLPDLAHESRIAQEGDVLRPGHTHDHAQPVARGGVEQCSRWHGIDPHRVDARFDHEPEVFVDARGRGELPPLGVGCEGAVGHTLDEEPASVSLEELAGDPGSDADHGVDAMRHRQWLQWCSATLVKRSRPPQSLSRRVLPTPAKAFE